MGRRDPIVGVDAGTSAIKFDALYFAGAQVGAEAESPDSQLAAVYAQLFEGYVSAPRAHAGPGVQTSLRRKRAAQTA